MRASVVGEEVLMWLDVRKASGGGQLAAEAGCERCPECMPMLHVIGPRGGPVAAHGSRPGGEKLSPLPRSQQAWCSAILHKPQLELVSGVTTAGMKRHWYTMVLDPAAPPPQLPSPLPPQCLATSKPSFPSPPSQRLSVSHRPPLSRRVSGSHAVLFQCCPPNMRNTRPPS